MSRHQTPYPQKQALDLKAEFAAAENKRKEELARKLQGRQQVLQLEEQTRQHFLGTIANGYAFRSAPPDDWRALPRAADRLAREHLKMQTEEQVKLAESLGAEVVEDFLKQDNLTFACERYGVALPRMPGLQVDEKPGDPRLDPAITADNTPPVLLEG